MTRAVGALAAGSGLRITAVDIGSRTGISAHADSDGQVVSLLHGFVGLCGLTTVPDAASRVSRLAGDAGDEAAVADLLQTLGARPASLPQTVEELSATQVAARVQL